MSEAELIFTALAELFTRQIAETAQATGMPFNCPHDAVAVRRGERLTALQSDRAIQSLYARHRNDPLIKWKDSIKKVVGLKRPAVPGLDE
jgi:hypothetical protein